MLIQVCGFQNLALLKRIVETEQVYVEIKREEHVKVSPLRY